MPAYQSNTPSSPSERMTLRVALVWLLFAISSLVFIEPAPYDGLLIALGITYFAFGLKAAPNISTPLFLISGYILANIIAATVSNDPLDCLKHITVTYYLIFGWFFMVSIIYDQPVYMFDVIWKGYIFAAVLAVAIGLVGYLGLTSFSAKFMFYDRVQGPFKDPNVFGPFLIPVAVYMIMQMETATNTVVFFQRLAILLLMVVGVLLSFSRGAWGNLVFSALMYAVFRLATAKSSADTAKLVRLIIFVIGFLAVAAVAAISTIDNIGQSFENRAQLVQDYDQGSMGRFDGIMTAIRLAFERPLGIGPGRSSAELPLDPHNLFVHILVETGWLGALSFSAFIVLTLREGYWACLQPSALQKICIVAYVCLVSTLFESMIIHSTHWRHLYVLFAMVWGVVTAKRGKII